MSLTEAVIALYLLTIVILATSSLIDSGLRMEGRAQRANLAAVVAGKHMARIRQAAGDATAFDGWALDGTVVDPEYPQFTITVDSEWQTVFSPCSQLEAPYTTPLDTRRAMRSSFRKVRVRVAWGGAADERLDLISLVGSPDGSLAAGLSSLELSPVALAPLNRADKVNLAAQALDTGQRPIPDLFYAWKVVPQASVGSLPSLSRDGSTASFQHYYKRDQLTGQDIYGPAGACDVSATVRYMGRETSNTVRCDLLP